MADQMALDGTEALVDFKMMMSLRLTLITYLTLIALATGYFIGGNDGYDMGIAEGKADCFLKSNGCHFKHTVREIP